MKVMPHYIIMNQFVLEWVVLQWKRHRVKWKFTIFAKCSLCCHSNGCLWDLRVLEVERLQGTCQWPRHSMEIWPVYGYFRTFQRKVHWGLIWIHHVLLQPILVWVVLTPSKSEKNYVFNVFFPWISKVTWGRTVFIFCIFPTGKPNL